MLKRYAMEISIERKRTKKTVEICEINSFVVETDIGKIVFHLCDSPGLGKHEK